MLEWPRLDESLRQQLPDHHRLEASFTLAPLKISESATFVVDGWPGPNRRAVVRVYRSARHALSRITAELQWIEELHREGFATPAVIRTIDGSLTFPLEGPDGVVRTCAVFEFLPPDRHRPDLDTTVEELGALAAQLQRHGATWCAGRDVDRPRWDLAATLAEDTDWGSWPSLDLSAAHRALFLRAREAVAGALPDLDDAATLLHADLKTANSIWSGGRLHAIDFDDCGFGLPLFDLAASLTGLEDDPRFPALVHRWLEGYRRHRVVSADDLRLVPAFVAQRRLMILGWLHAHPDAHAGPPVVDEFVAGTANVLGRFLSGELSRALATA